MEKGLKTNLLNSRSTSGPVLADRGFTLLEVIVTLTVAAIVGGMLVQLMRSGPTASAKTLVDVQGAAILENVLEQITRDYRNWIQTNPASPLTDFESVAASSASAAITVQTGSGEVDPGNDADIERLWVSVTDGTRTLRVLFTR